MKSKIELLAPGGDVDSIKAAVLAGADAVYCGLDRFNARNRAENITFDELTDILELAHANDCEVFLTINIIIVESELPAFIKLLNRLVNTGVDGVIVQDLGAFYLLKKYFPSLKVHASTQMTTHNEGQVKFLKELSVSRVNLCRELNLDEIKQLTEAAHVNDILTEVFVHGANCISFSGLCYFSSIHGGNSGNRGRCSQQCRSQYATTDQGKSFPLNLKDNSAFDHLDELISAGVDSLKIEGRIKKYDYVYTVVDAWRKHIDSGLSSSSGSYQKKDTPCNGSSSKKILYKVFNRDLSDDYLTGVISKDMFIDNPRDNSARNLAEEKGDCSKSGIDNARDEINAERAEIMNDIKGRLTKINASSNSHSADSLHKSDVVKIPDLKRASEMPAESTLSVLISSESELQFCQGSGLDIYFKLPDSLKGRSVELEELFAGNKQLTPWFPSILIGDDFCAAVNFMKKTKPEFIVTNNTGIAFEAFRQGITWIAGPYLNIANSYSLKCLKEYFDCGGAFISNELSRNQIGAIKKPDNFKLFYSVYHPAMLMTSRQCLFHSVTGCPKNKIDDRCVPDCIKSSSITNMQGADFIIEKSSGNYNKVYNAANFFCPDIAIDMPNRFESFFIDLSDIQTETRLHADKPKIISLFKSCVNGSGEAVQELKKMISPCFNNSYKKGI